MLRSQYPSMFRRCEARLSAVAAADVREEVLERQSCSSPFARCRCWWACSCVELSVCVCVCEFTQLVSRHSSASEPPHQQADALFCLLLRCYRTCVHTGHTGVRNRSSSSRNSAHENQQQAAAAGTTCTSRGYTLKTFCSIRFQENVRALHDLYNTRLLLLLTTTILMITVSLKVFPSAEPQSRIRPKRLHHRSRST